MKKSKSNYRIIWKKWDDPATQIKNHFEKQMRQQLLNNLNQDTFNDAGEIPSMGQVGIIPMNDLSAFNFWIGHTNFNITLPIAKLLEQVQGVETLDIISPYRFRMSIGQAFDENTTKLLVAHSLNRYLRRDKQKTLDLPTQ